MVMFEKHNVMIRPAFFLLGFTFLSTLFLSLPVAHAEDSVVTTTSITISQSCSMTSTVNTPHNATVINGTYSGSSYPNGIGQTTLKAFCNDNAGFAIYAIGFTDDEYGNTKLHSSTLDSTYDINTGIYNSVSASSSTWSMKLTSVSGTYAPTIADGTNGLENFTTWHVVPSTYTKVAYRTTSTDVDYSGSGIGSSLTTTYDAYVSATQPAGTYVGQVKYTLVHPHTQGAPVICNPSGTTISTILCMQDITSSNKSAVLASMTADQQYTLKDSRDGKSYLVSKLADGNIWMTQNLDHNLVTDGSVIYDSTTTDLPANTTWVPSAATRSASDTTWNNTTTAPESYDPGDKYVVSNSSTPSDTGDANWHLGNYYNWLAAAATNNASSYTANYVSDRSICPAGWTLPRGITENNPSSGSFQYLLNQFSWASATYSIFSFDSQHRGATQLDPINFAASGRWNGSNNVIGNVYLWSSTISSSGNAHMYFDDSTGAYPGFGQPFSWGVPIRCIVLGS